jgi:CheY-like chemotaxis protein
MDKKLISEVVKEEDEVYAPFAVPGLKALVVDDIETNLVVTKGLLGPYGFDVTVCDRGAKAIELTKEKKYDLVFIDHMMPEMDGTETMKRIREFSPHYRKVPIIALTAAVMAGMKEMFLSKGFDDFLGKPIELKNLNTILERWIPKELRTTPIKREEPEIKDKEDLGISIEGVDVDKGLRYIGGEKSNYIKALSVFCKDIDKRLDLFRNIAKENISNFQVQVHAIKSASANIGAINLSKEAQLLEDAAINGDLYTIRSRYSSFHKLLSKTTDLIKDALVKESIESEVTDFKSGGKINVERDILITLKEAIDSRDIGTIDRILDNLSSRPNDLETRETIERISNHVLLADYDEAGLLVMIHLTREKTAS